MTTASPSSAVPAFRREPHPAPIPASRRDEIHADPGFGRYFTDHMVLIDYDTKSGWGANERRAVETCIAFAQSNLSHEVKSEARSAAISYELDKLPGFPTDEYRQPQPDRRGRR